MSFLYVSSPDALLTATNHTCVQFAALGHTLQRTACQNCDVREHHSLMATSCSLQPAWLKLGRVQAFIGLGLSIGQVTESGHADYGTAWGVASESAPAEATWNIFVALGSMAFAYSFVRLLCFCEQPVFSVCSRLIRRVTPVPRHLRVSGIRKPLQCMKVRSSMTAGC